MKHLSCFHAFGITTRWALAMKVVLIHLIIAACTPLGQSPTLENQITTNAISPTNNTSVDIVTQASQGATPTSELTATITPTTRPKVTVPPLIPTLTPFLTMTFAAPSPTPCPPELCSYSSQYFLERPIASPGNDSIDVTYRFGSTQGGRRDPHHGVEFLNGNGTPVLAAADGLVVVARDDRQPTSAQGVWPITFYGPYSYFYGNLVVIQHQPPPGLLLSFQDLPQTIYTLYGHLSAISVQVGQKVIAGQEIGKVGMTGVAEGSHLHFEVRLGENSYKSSRNPELWLKPNKDENEQLMGGIAGNLVDSYGNNLQLSSIVIERLDDLNDQSENFQATLLSYEEKALIGLAPWEESFGIGDLPPGWYRITYPYQGLQQRVVEVLPGQLTVVSLK